MWTKVLKYLLWTLIGGKNTYKQPTYLQCVPNKTNMLVEADGSLFTLNIDFIYFIPIAIYSN